MAIMSVKYDDVIFHGTGNGYGGVSFSKVSQRLVFGVGTHILLPFAVDNNVPTYIECDVTPTDLVGNKNVISGTDATSCSIRLRFGSLIEGTVFGSDLLHDTAVINVDELRTVGISWDSGIFGWLNVSGESADAVNNSKNAPPSALLIGVVSDLVNAQFLGVINNIKIWDNIDKTGEPIHQWLVNDGGFIIKDSGTIGGLDGTLTLGEGSWEDTVEVLPATGVTENSGESNTKTYTYDGFSTPTSLGDIVTVDYTSYGNQLQDSSGRRLKDLISSPVICDGGSAVKHFFDMAGVVPSPISGNNSIQDIVTKEIPEVSSEAYDKYMCQNSVPGAIKINWDLNNPDRNFPVAPLSPTQSRVVIVVGRIDKNITGNRGGGEIAFTPRGNVVLRAREGRLSIGTTDAAYQEVNTTKTCRMSYRDHGVVYVMAAVERVESKTFEHYVYDDSLDAVVLAGSTTYSTPEELNTVAKDRSDWVANVASMSFGHGTGSEIKCSGDNLNGGGDCPGVPDPTWGYCGVLGYWGVGGDGSEPDDGVTDYYGALICYFDGGSPDQSEMIKALEFYREQWPAGNKAIYPGWK